MAAEEAHPVGVADSTTPVGHGVHAKAPTATRADLVAVGALTRLLDRSLSEPDDSIDPDDSSDDSGHRTSKCRCAVISLLDLSVCPVFPASHRASHSQTEHRYFRSV